MAIVQNFDHYGLSIVEFDDGREYAIALSSDDADQACHEYIKDSLWAFNASFLANMTDLPSEVFTALQEKCEDANDTFLTLVEKTCGLVKFVQSAISADGRGNFLSGYDGEETVFANCEDDMKSEIMELIDNGDLDCNVFDPTDCYIYRVN